MPLKKGGGEGGGSFGPSEDGDSMWRTTVTHTPEQMMEVLKELYFAGFPCAGPDRQAPNLPETFIRDYFARFGTVEHLHFDGARGIGSVTFKDGETAEQCYVATHLSVLPDTSRSSVSKERGALFHILYLEFAQFLPFVNPLMLRDAELNVSITTRQLMRTFPHLQRFFTLKTGSGIAWDSTKASGGKSSTSSSSSFLKGGNAAVGEAGGGGRAAGAGTVDFSPFVSEVLQLEDEPKVSMMDLWYAFFDRFVARKSRGGARSRFLKSLGPVYSLFADKKTVYEELFDACCVSSASSAENVNPLARRLYEDESLHCTLAFFNYKLRVRNDPALSAFIGAVLALAERKNPQTIGKDAEKRKKRIAVEEGGGGGEEGLLAAMLADSSEAEQTMRKMTHMECALNLLMNANTEATTGSGSVGRNGGDSRLPGNADRAFEHVVELVESSAASGSAASLVPLCCDPDEFKRAKAAAPTAAGMLLQSLKTPALALGVLVALLAFLIWAIGGDKQ